MFPTFELGAVHLIFVMFPKLFPPLLVCVIPQLKGAKLFVLTSWYGAVVVQVPLPFTGKLELKDESENPATPLVGLPNEK